MDIDTVKIVARSDHCLLAHLLEDARAAVQLHYQCSHPCTQALFQFVNVKHRRQSSFPGHSVFISSAMRHNVWGNVSTGRW